MTFSKAWGIAMAYEVCYASSFCDELDEVVGLLVETGGKTAGAKRFMKRLSQIKASLEAFPESFPRVDDGYLRLRGYRKAVMGNHILLYRISEHRAVIEDDEIVEHGVVGGYEGVVRVTHLFNARQDWQSLV